MLTNKGKIVMAKLITLDILKKLQANNKIASQTGESTPVILKLFGGNCTWVINEIEPDGDTLLGLCDIGHGCCEYGTVSLNELKSIRFPPFGLPIERDRYFKEGTIQSFRNYYQENNTLSGC